MRERADGLVDARVTGAASGLAGSIAISHHSYLYFIGEEYMLDFLVIKNSVLIDRRYE